MYEPYFGLDVYYHKGRAYLPFVPPEDTISIWYEEWRRIYPFSLHYIDFKEYVIYGYFYSDKKKERRDRNISNRWKHIGGAYVRKKHHKKKPKKPKKRRERNVYYRFYKYKQFRENLGYRKDRRYTRTSLKSNPLEYVIIPRRYWCNAWNWD